MRHITLNWLTGKELMLITPICELFEVLFYVTLLMSVQDERNEQHEKKLQALEVSNLSIGVQM